MASNGLVTFLMDSGDLAILCIAEAYDRLKAVDSNPIPVSPNNSVEYDVLDNSFNRGSEKIILSPHLHCFSFIGVNWPRLFYQGCLVDAELSVSLD